MSLELPGFDQLSVPIVSKRDILRVIHPEDSEPTPKDFCEIDLITPDSESWQEMGQLRSRIYVHKLKYLPESVLDEDDCEFDEYDISPATKHYITKDQHGKVIGTVRVIARDPNVNDGLLPSEIAYGERRQEDAVELSRFIVDKKSVELMDSAVISIAMLRAGLHHLREDHPRNTKLYAMLDDPLIAYFRDIVGMDIKTIDGAKRLNEYDTVGALMEADPNLITSQIAKYELTTDRSIGIIDRVAPFFEDKKVTRGLGLISLRESAISNERFERNLGWFSEKEQKRLKESTVSIAGVGGDGGTLAVSLARTGVGSFILADPEVFEIENLNRQEGADYTTIGRNKAEVIAEKIKMINPNALVRVYTEGVNEQNIEEFVRDADLVIDETEYTRQELAVMIAREARKYSLPVLSALNVGFGAFVTSYDPHGAHFEKQLKVKDTTSLADVAEQPAAIENWVPHIPSYADMSQFKKVASGERSTPTVSSGVHLAAGIATTQAIAHLLSPISPERKKWIKYYPKGISVDAIDGMRTVRNAKFHFYRTAGKAAIRTMMRRNPKV